MFLLFEGNVGNMAVTRKRPHRQRANVSFLSFIMKFQKIIVYIKYPLGDRVWGLWTAQLRSIICNEETSTNVKYFASLPYGLLLQERMYRFQNRGNYKRKVLDAARNKCFPLEVTHILEARY